MILSETLLQRVARKYKKRMRGFSPATFSILMRYNGPGNVRELDGVIEHAVLFAQGDTLLPEHLPDHINTSRRSPYLCVIPPYLTKDDIEREAIAQNARTHRRQHQEDRADTQPQPSHALSKIASLRSAYESR